MADHNDFIEEISLRIQEYSQNNRLFPEERAKLARQIFDAVGGTLQGAASLLHAPNAVVEVLDEESGQLCRRYLELEYVENANGIQLTGEDISGNQVQIVFLSESAIARLNELRGAGPDKPRCEDHGE